MIERVEVDRREYEIELDGNRAFLRRLEPPSVLHVSMAVNELYDFATGQWDIAEIERVIRSLERHRLFDIPASAGKGGAP